jgi:protein-S-isoprenylcysteine O-methyltransferase Ste14
MSSSVPVSLGRFLFRYRSFLPAVVYLLLLVLRPQPFPKPWLLYTAGALSVAAGASLRLWAIAKIGKRARTRKDKARVLVVWGPFAITRNPLYIANMLTGSGFFLVFGLPWYLPIYLFLAGTFYSFIVRYEESLLVEKFGNRYRRYMRLVPRWIPDSVPAGAFSGSSYSASDVLRWERSYIGLLVLGVLCLAAKRFLYP